MATILTDQNFEDVAMQGELNVSDDVIFRNSVYGCRLMGLNYKDWFRGGVKHPVDNESEIWFPQFENREDWENIYGENGDYIIERHHDASQREEHVYNCIHNYRQKRIVFGKKDGYYKFMGIYTLDVDRTNQTEGVCWVKNQDSVNIIV